MYAISITIQNFNNTIQKHIVMQKFQTIQYQHPHLKDLNEKVCAAAIFPVL